MPTDTPATNTSPGDSQTASPALEEKTEPYEKTLDADNEPQWQDDAPQPGWPRSQRAEAPLRTAQGQGVSPNHRLDGRNLGYLTRSPMKSKPTARSNSEAPAKKRPTRSGRAKAVDSAPSQGETAAIGTGPEASAPSGVSPVHSPGAAQAAPVHASSQVPPPQAQPPAKPETTLTRVAARIDIGMGNTLYIRGQGDGLSWERGQPMKCLGATTWVWSTASAGARLVFKVLLNDREWSLGENISIEAGQSVEVTPQF